MGKMSSDPQATPVAADVWRITTPLPFRPRTVHAYLVRLADGWLLVDGGANTDDAWGVLDAGVRRVAGGWSGVRLHVVTHMHVDHVGLAERVRDASGAPLAMGRLDAERAAHAHADPDEEHEYRGALLREGGVPDEVAEAMRGPRGGRNPFTSHVPADHLLPHHDAPIAGAPGWASVWTPGHTAGHVGLYRRADGLLLAGDAVLPRITPTIGVNRQREDAVGDYLDTLRRLAALDPSLGAGGHGDPLQPVVGRLRELREATEAESAAVAALLAVGPATAWQVARARYAERALPPAAWMQALRETLAHLRHLARTGRARAAAAPGGVVRFWPE